MLADWLPLSLPYKNAPPVIISLSFEMGFLFLLTFRIDSKASMLYFFNLLPDNYTYNRLSFCALFSSPVKKSTSAEVRPVLYLISSILKFFELARVGVILLNASLPILLFEILSRSNLGQTSIKFVNESSQSSYWLSPRLLYSMLSCLSEGLRMRASKISLNPCADMSLLLISRISNLRC